MGLSRWLVASYFPGLPSRISGIGLHGIRRKVAGAMHDRAFDEEAAALPVGGLYRFRQRGESHAFEGRLIHVLQSAVANDSFALWRKYVEGVREAPPIHLRDLMEFAPRADPVPIEEVESITEIRKRLVAPGHLARRA